MEKKESHIIIDIVEKPEDFFSSDNWKEEFINDFRKIQEGLETNPNAESPAYYTWFWFYMKYGKALTSSGILNSDTPFGLVKNTLGLSMSGGGAYPIGFNFYNNCLKDTDAKEAGGVSFRKVNWLVADKLSFDHNDGKLPILAAIRTKPFVLLAGISGTGKSRIVRRLAQATDDIDTFTTDVERWKKHNPANFKLIQVKPNWHNSMDVVGYLSNIGGKHYEFTPFVRFVAEAWKHPETPYFLCLDEMNLAPVEEYFAEYLSAIESRSYEKDENGNDVYETDPIIEPFIEYGEGVCAKMITELLGDKPDDNIAKRFRQKGLTLPENLIVMGTVNMDETTFSFSRKVLDRAMSIEMNEVDYDQFLAGTTENDIPNLVENNKLFVKRPIKAAKVLNILSGEANVVVGYLKEVNAILDKTPFKLGYRAANEALLYLSACKSFNPKITTESAIDQFTLMKILSRIEGDDAKLMKGDVGLLPLLREVIVQKCGEVSESIQKLDEMAVILKRDHFVSYWS